MSSTVATLRPSDTEIHPELVAIERQFQSESGTTGNPYLQSQSYNISQCDPSGTYVQLPAPHDGETWAGWESVSQTGDSGCVEIETAGYCGVFTGVWLTWNHPGQTTLTCRSASLAGGPAGDDILLFTIFACG